MGQAEPKARVLLGVTGGIAAYKSCELSSLLIKSGYEVRVVMTKSATQFVGPISFAAITGNPVFQTLFDPVSEAAISHIDLARWADVLLIAPATANYMSKAAMGLADDLLSTISLACNAPVILAPAMNPQMWEHPATQTNLGILQGRGVNLVGPACGRTACGEEGTGRMAQPLDIVDALDHLLAHKDLAGVVVLISAGPTREHLDPVRYISNPSTGRMGIELARAAHKRGARVHLVLGPTQLPPPAGVHTVLVSSAAQMHDAVMDLAPKSQVIIKSAAVSDFKPESVQEHKVKKLGRSEETLKLVGTADILAELGKAKTEGQILVGFAAETRDLIANGQKKLAAKNLDLLVANQVGSAMSGFAAKTNQAHILDSEGGDEALPLMTKLELANIILDRVSALLPREDPDA